MTRSSLFGVGGLCLLVLGCETAVVPTASTESKIESYRDPGSFDGAERHFLLNGLQTPAQVHGVYVTEFTSQPNFGGMRMPPPPRSPSQWTELVSESEGSRIREHGPSKGQPRYDAIKEMLTYADGQSETVRERVWLVKEHLLVSVNAEAGPAVFQTMPKTPFVSPHDMMKAPKPANTAEIPKRPLSEFETTAVAKLREGDDMVLLVEGDVMHAAGAIRARTECLACHKTNKVGDMLGAFTYTLALQSEATPAADRLTDLEGLTDQERAAVEAIEALGGKVHREAGGPVTKVDLAFSRNAEIKANNRIWPATTRSQPHNSALSLLGAFPDLKSLDVSNTLISDDGADTIASLTKLKELNVNGSQMSGTGLARINEKLPDCVVTGHTPATPGAAP